MKKLFLNTPEKYKRNLMFIHFKRISESVVHGRLLSESPGVLVSMHFPAPQPRDTEPGCLGEFVFLFPSDSQVC